MSAAVETNTFSYKEREKGFSFRQLDTSKHLLRKCGASVGQATPRVSQTPVWAKLLSKGSRLLPEGEFTVQTCGGRRVLCIAASTKGLCEQNIDKGGSSRLCCQTVARLFEAPRLENLLELLSWAFYFPCELTQKGPYLKARRFQALFSSGLFVPVSARGPISVFLIGF